MRHLCDFSSLLSAVGSQRATGLTVAVSILVTVAGCGGLKNIMPVENRQIRAAIKNNDMALLQDVCDGKRRVRYDSDRSRACKHIKQQSATKGTCDDAVARYKGAPKNQKLVESFAREFAKCGHFTEIFEMLAHYGNGRYQRAIGMLAKEGVPMKKQWVKYMRTHKGRRFFAMGGATAHYGLQHIGNWLVAKGHTDLCKDYIAAATGASTVAQVWVMPYLKDAKCKGGAALVSGLLTADKANHRKWACQTLGVIGGKRAAKKMAVLASTDPYSVIREQRRGGRIWATKEFPVRAACKQAYGKIKLRSM